MPILKSCPCQGASLEKFVQPTILAVLAKESLHGYALAKRIEAILAGPGSGPHSSGIYKSLQTLERAGKVASRWDANGKGPAKHLYSLTPAGIECLATWADTLDSYHHTLTRVLQTVCASTLKKTGSCCGGKAPTSRQPLRTSESERQGCADGSTRGASLRAPAGKGSTRNTPRRAPAGEGSTAPGQPNGCGRVGPGPRMARRQPDGSGPRGPDPQKTAGRRSGRRKKAACQAPETDSPLRPTTSSPPPASRQPPRTPGRS